MIFDVCVGFLGHVLVAELLGGAFVFPSIGHFEMALSLWFYGCH